MCLIFGRVGGLFDRGSGKGFGSKMYVYRLGEYHVADAGICFWECMKAHGVW